MIEDFPLSVLMIYRKSLIDYLHGFIVESNSDGLYQLISEDDINVLMNSDESVQEKKNWILRELGYIRINLRAIVDSHIYGYEDNNRLDESVRLMDEYIDVVKQIIGNKNNPHLINRIKDFLKISRIDELFEYIVKWDGLHEKWIESHLQISQLVRQNLYDELKISYNMIYNLSFSSKNFP